MGKTTAHATLEHPNSYGRFKPVSSHGKFRPDETVFAIGDFRVNTIDFPLTALWFSNKQHITCTHLLIFLK